MKTLVKGRWVVAWDEAVGSHVIFEGGQVVFDGDRIVFAGKSYGGEVDRTIDASGCLVAPGFVNAHAEVTASIAPLFYDIGRPEGYFRPRSWLVDPEQRPVFTPEAIRAGAEQMCLLLAKSGSTTVAAITSMVFKRWDDPGWEPEVYAETARRFGLRTYLSHQYRDGARFVPAAPGEPEVIWDEARGFRGLERGIALVRRLQAAGDEMVQGLLFPYTLDAASPDLLRATRRAATELGTRIRMHFAQSRYEVEAIRARHGLTPVEYLDSLDFLGPDVLLTHATYIAGNHGTPHPDGRDLARLAATGTSVGHCPWVYAARGAYLGSFGRYRRAGINLVIGTDTHPTDLIAEMRWALVMGKTAEQSPTAVTAADVFNAVTVNGARWLGRTDLGRLAPGAKADLVLVDFDRPHLGGVVDPIRSLVYFASAHDVRTVICNGRTVVDGFRVVGVDEAEVVRRGRPVAEQIRRTVAEWDRQTGRDAGAVPPAFPVR